MNYAAELRELRNRRDAEIERLHQLGKSNPKLRQNNQKIARRLTVAHPSSTKFLGYRETANKRRRERWPPPSVLTNT
jgi:hypothetical protein